MNKEMLISLVAKRLTIRQIAIQAQTSYTNVRYWLRKYQLKTRRGPHGSINGELRNELKLLSPKKRKCGCCGTTDITKFYGKRRDYCGKCFNKKKIEAGRKRRAWAISLLGGKCILCGFNKWNSALDFHHLDPESKDVGFKHLRYWSQKRCEKELSRCALVCKNCHAGIHSGDISVPDNRGMG
jgi:hypothetical protein